MTRQDGFSLVELLLAAAITLIVLGGAFRAGGTSAAYVSGTARSVRHAAANARGRGCLAERPDDGRRRHVCRTGPRGAQLSHCAGHAVRAFGDTPDPARGIFFRTDAISFLYVPSTPSQTRLSATLAPGALDPLIESPPNCPLATPEQVCGLNEDDRVLLADLSGSWDLYSVDRVVNGVMSFQHRGQPSLTRYPAGAAVAEIRAGTYYLKTDVSAGTFQLMRHDGWATELPVVDEVVGLEFRYFGSAEPPQLTGVPLEAVPGPWTTYGPPPPPIGASRGAWPPGENCTFAVVDGIHTPRLPTLAPGGLALVELTSAHLSDGPWCPDQLSRNSFRRRPSPGPPDSRHASRAVGAGIICAGPPGRSSRAAVPRALAMVMCPI